jgi:Sulfotransferase family
MDLSLEDIVDAARAKTGGLPDPDSDSWREGLGILIKDHNKAARLTEAGYQTVRSRYVDLLANRMQVDEFMRQNPSVARSEIKRPVFILGLPRTGTTMLSYLMEADPANRTPLRWELSTVVPPAAPGALRTDPRCLEAVAGDEDILRDAGKVAAAHFEPGDGPTECVHSLAQDFRSLMLAVTNTTPVYHDWLLLTDMTTAFAHRKRVLQILQSTNPGRWVLKMPSDSLFIRQVFKTFPDARVIWTHRDPYNVFGSSMQMRAGGRPFTEVDENRDYIRQYFPLQLGLHAARALEFSKERPDVIYHCYYQDLIKDPLAEVRRIYDWLGDEWTPASQESMEGWLRGNPQNKHGKHQYALEDWGYTKDDLTPYFSDYLREHPVEN